VVREGLLNSYVGDYRLVDFLGAGGMGEVYRAVNTRTGQVAAAKILTQATDRGLIERFFNEARIQASIQHPNIARFYEFHDLNGQPCIVMEYIHGQTLAERIRALGCLPMSETIYIFQCAVEAVGYIHNQGIVHRDIKSNNIKLSSAGQVKLLDFGIAKAESTPKMTATGGVVGTLQYLSPEQLKGGTADTRSDIWALGILLYEMVTGQVPFEANTIGELYEKIIKVSYVPATALNPLVPREVEAVISRCLKRKSADRYQSAQELLQHVARLAATVATPRSAVVERKRMVFGKTKESWRLLSSIAAAIVLVLVLVVYLSIPGPEPKPNPPPPAPTPTPIARGTKTLEVALTEGTAKVYRGGTLIGATSAAKPLRFPANVGEKIVLRLEQDGYEDRFPQPFTVETAPDVQRYTFDMRKKVAPRG
jgi:serine/threonine protein kinase